MPLRLRWALVTPILVLAGLFGMHGLGEQSAAQPEMAMAMPSAMTPAVTAVSTATTAAAAVAAVPVPGDDMTGMVMGLCVAVLLGGLVVRLLLGAAGRRTPWVLPRAALAVLPVPRSRAPDPPTPALLSVYRC